MVAQRFGASERANLDHRVGIRLTDRPRRVTTEAPIEPCQMQPNRSTLAVIKRFVARPQDLAPGC